MENEKIIKELEKEALSKDAAIGCLNNEITPVVVTSQSGNTLITVNSSYSLITKDEKIKVLSLMSAWISEELNSL